MSIDLYLGLILIASGIIGLAITVIGGVREMRREEGERERKRTMPSRIPPPSLPKRVSDPELSGCGGELPQARPPKPSQRIWKV